MKNLAFKLSALLGLTAAVGIWRHTRGTPYRSPRQHVADSIDEVLYLSPNPVTVYPDDEEDVPLFVGSADAPRCDCHGVTWCPARRPAA